MEVAEWRTELLRQAERVMKQGGELKFKVLKRGRERIPEIFIYLDNYVHCKNEILITD